MCGEDAVDQPGLLLAERLDFLEDGDRARGIVDRGVEILRAQIIGFGLVTPAEVQERCGYRETRGLARHVSADARKQDAHRNTRDVRKLRLGRLARHVARGHVGDLMGHGGCQLILFAGQFDESRVNKHESSGQGECVRGLPLHHLKAERDHRIGIAHQVLPHAVDEPRGHRIFHHFRLELNLVGELLSQCNLFLQRVKVDAVVDLPIPNLRRVVFLIF